MCLPSPRGRTRRLASTIARETSVETPQGVVHHWDMLEANGRGGTRPSRYLQGTVGDGL